MFDSFINFQLWVCLSSSHNFRTFQLEVKDARVCLSSSPFFIGTNCLIKCMRQLSWRCSFWITDLFLCWSPNFCKLFDIIFLKVCLSTLFSWANTVLTVFSTSIALYTNRHSLHAFFSDSVVIGIWTIEILPIFLEEHYYSEQDGSCKSLKN